MKQNSKREFTTPVQRDAFIHELVCKHDPGMRPTLGLYQTDPDEFMRVADVLGVTKDDLYKYCQARETQSRPGFFDR